MQQLRASHNRHPTATPHHQVTLVVPFVPPADQPHIFPPGVLCHTPAQQAALIRAWAREHSGLEQQPQQQQPHAHPSFTILFYRARYHPGSRCIFACEDISSLVPREVRLLVLGRIALRVLWRACCCWVPLIRLCSQPLLQCAPEITAASRLPRRFKSFKQASVVLLEEPEHLNWFAARRRWSSRHGHVVGVLHTHYSGYARDLPGGAINEAAVGLVCRIVCRLHCHKVRAAAAAAATAPTAVAVGGATLSFNLRTPQPSCCSLTQHPSWRCPCRASSMRMHTPLQVVQLSQLAPGLARSTTVNVHGVSECFLAEGQRVAVALARAQQAQAGGGATVAAAAGSRVFSKV